MSEAPQEPQPSGTTITDTPPPPADPETRPIPRAQRLREQADSTLEDAVKRFPLIGECIVATDRERASGGILLSGGLAYRLFFWLVPLGLLAATVAGFFTSPTAEGLESTAKEHGLPGVAASTASDAIAATDHQLYLVVTATALTIWTGYGVVRAMNIVFALAWGQKPPKVRRPPVAGLMFTVLAFVLSGTAALIALAASTIGLGFVAEGVAAVIAYGGAALGVSLLFPHGDAPPRALIPGALLVSAGALAVHATVSVYLAPKLDRSTDTYGMLGASTVILLWLYLIARLITLSAFLNATLWDRHAHGADAA